MICVTNRIKLQFSTNSLKNRYICLQTKNCYIAFPFFGFDVFCYHAFYSEEQVNKGGHRPTRIYTLPNPEPAAWLLQNTISHCEIF